MTDREPAAHRDESALTAEGAATLAPLTGIRFVAAILVFNAHLVPPAGAPAVVSGFALAGHDWMTMFFVLSGLILTWNYDRLLTENGARLAAGAPVSGAAARPTNATVPRAIQTRYGTVSG